MSEVVFKHVVKKYDNKVTAVADFDLEIKDKEFVVFVGPSGCGKTTTLRMVAGLEEITEGELYIDNKLINHVAPKERDIAMVFQNYALYPHMTVYENMAFALKLRKMPKAEIKRRVTEYAKILHIDYLLDRKPKALSGGQRQRVALGRAIVRNPKVFLMDEPLSNLDAKLRVEMRTEICKLHHQLQATIIYVTHDQTEAMTMGTKIVVMRDGYIQQVDTPKNLYEKPCNMFVAGFLGSPQMNFRNAVVEKKENDLYLTFGRNSIKLPEEKAGNPALQDYIGREIMMGIRAENIQDDSVNLNSAKDSTVEAKVELLEMLGAETLLYVKIEDTDFVARVSPSTHAEIGDNIQLAFDANKLHLFDKDSERAI